MRARTEPTGHACARRDRRSVRASFGATKSRDAGCVPPRPWCRIPALGRCRSRRGTLRIENREAIYRNGHSALRARGAGVATTPHAHQDPPLPARTCQPRSGPWLADRPQRDPAITRRYLIRQLGHAADGTSCPIVDGCVTNAPLHGCNRLAACDSGRHRCQGKPQVPDASISKLGDADMAAPESP